MKKFYRISWNIDSSPWHILRSAVFAAYVMFYINMFVGTMGGIPALLGIFFVFYFLRAMVLEGNRISHQLSMKSSKEVAYLFGNYAVGFVVIWFATRGMQLFSKITGWSSIKGISLKGYMDLLYGSTMLERWAYFFSWILMFSFVLSLFPLVVIKKRNQWVAYFIADSLVFAGISYMIQAICRIFIDNDKEKRASCVVDNLLLCEIPHRWQAASYVVAILVFAVLIAFFVYLLGAKFYGPKPGKLVYVEKVTSKNRNKIFTFAISVGVLLLAGIILFLEMPSSDPTRYKKVAECKTDDSVLGPMVYGKEFYVPTDEKLDYVENGVPVGYMGYLDQNCDTRFYRLVIANLIYRPLDDKTYLQMYGADKNNFVSMKVAEADETWKEDEVFLLWDEDWVGETAYGEVTGYSVCEKTFVESLELKYGQVEYNEEDFSDYDAYFTIRGYKELKSAVEGEKMHGDWVGCILVKDNIFYYGNKNNPIVGLQLQQLLDILGGNER